MPRASLNLPLLAAIALCLLGSQAFAQIKIDGYDTDWQGLPAASTHYSVDTIGDGQAPGWDISKFWCYYGWSPTLKMYAWNYMSEQASTLPSSPNHTDRLFILINADGDLSTGNPNQFGYAGVDYYITMAPSTLSPYTMSDVGLFKWTWNGVKWVGTTQGATKAAWGNQGAVAPTYWTGEFAVDPSRLLVTGDKDPSAVWCAAYLDSAYSAQGPFNGDRAPNINVNDPAASWRKCRTPEPATTALFGLGLIGLAAIRRRRAA